MARAATTTDVFNAIAEAKRREMIGLLNNGKYWTVSEIVGRMKITQPTASKHLRVLRKVGIVTVVKHGRYRQYRLNAQSLRPLSCRRTLTNLELHKAMLWALRA